MMDLRCFVRVLPGLGEAPGGTGYLISRDRVLTAAHVVGEAERVSIEHDAAEGEDVVRLEASVHWRGDEACDVALLLLDKSVDLDVTLPRLADTPVETLTPWESRGWALASEDEPRVRDSMVDLHGGASAFLADQKRSQLTVDPQLLHGDQWRGASGAPIFEQGTDRILGLVAEVLLDSENRWYASPMSAAFLRPSFFEALGGKIVRERRDQLVAQVTSVLNKPAVAEAIASCDDAWKDKNPQALADAILSTDVVEMLNRLNKLHTRLSREKRTAVEEVVALIAPVLVQRRVLHAGKETATWVGDLSILGSNNAPLLDPIAWYGGNSGEGFELEGGHDSSDWPEKQYQHSLAGTRLVALKDPNPVGVYDMLGNVWEWCADWYESYQEASLAFSAAPDPQCGLSRSERPP